MTIICAWCTLRKDVNEYGNAIWPEDWTGLNKTYISRESQEYKEASHGMCPSCSAGFVVPKTFIGKRGY
jgi:hypothetical protein